ncbi:MAG: VOC family protein [Sphingomonadales bacterium]|nr:VOC family protein [Sphingomonadales bacterium]
MTIRNHRAAIDQLGFVVVDLDHAVRSWTERFGVGPWTVFRNVTMRGTYLGQPTTVTIDVALGYRGEEQIEFITVRSTTPSPYQDDAGEPLEGLHHLAWIVEDLEGETAALEREGMTTVFAASNPAVRVVYLADPAAPGTLFELISGPDSRAMHRDGLARAAGWDGRDPVVEIDLSTLG